MMKSKKGFTLAELLIVVAIIAVLVAIAIPVFASELEKSREATDLANVRSAYAEVMDSAVLGGGSYQATVSLRQRQDGWTMDKKILDIGGITPDNTAHWVGYPKSGSICTVRYDSASDMLTIRWGEGDEAYLEEASHYKGKSLMELKDMQNEARVKADQTTLRALGNEILNKGWTLDQLKTTLGILVEGNAVRIADYYQLKSGTYNDGGQYESAGFKISGTSSLSDILGGIGYEGGSSTSANSDNKVDTTYENPLFYSDELGSNQLHDYGIDATKRSIIIDSIQTDSAGVITKMRIYSKAMDNQANMSDSEKAKFRITVKK